LNDGWKGRGRDLIPGIRSKKKGTTSLGSIHVYLTRRGLPASSSLGSPPRNTEALVSSARRLAMKGSLSVRFHALSHIRGGGRSRSLYLSYEPATCWKIEGNKRGSTETRGPVACQKEKRRRRSSIRRNRYTPAGLKHTIEEIHGHGRSYPFPKQNPRLSVK